MSAGKIGRKALRSNGAAVDKAFPKCSSGRKQKNLSFHPALQPGLPPFCTLSGLVCTEEVHHNFSSVALVSACRPLCLPDLPRRWFWDVSRYYT